VDNITLPDGKRVYITGPADWLRIIRDHVGPECEAYVEGLQEENEYLNKELEEAGYYE
jgi:hypothetical protein